MKRNLTNILFLLLMSVAFISCSSLKKSKEAEYSLLKGVNYSQQGKYQKGMEEYQKSYKINPNNAILLKEMGYTYYKFGNYQKAEEYWLKALKLQPKDEGLIKNLVTLYFEDGKYAKSINMMGSSYNPRDDYYKKIKGLIAYREGDYRKSYNLLKDLSLESYDTEVALIYIDVLKKADEKRELFYFLKNIYPYLNKDKEFILGYSGVLNENFKMPKESEKILLEYLVKNGNDDEVLTQLSMIYLKMGDKKKSKDTLKLLGNKDIFQENYKNLEGKLN